jgi:hypothetical protein
MLNIVGLCSYLQVKNVRGHCRVWVGKGNKEMCVKACSRRKNNLGKLMYNIQHKDCGKQ